MSSRDIAPVKPRRSLSAIAGSVVVQVFMLCWALVVLFPLVISMMTSLKGNTEIYTNPLGIDFADLRWGNYTTAMQGPVGGNPLWMYFGNSVIATVLSTAIATLLGALAGYGLARAQGRLGAGMTRLFTVILTIPALATFVPIFNLMGSLGLRNSVLGISFVYAAFLLPGTAILTRPYFAAIPIDLLEAARLDGAGEVRIFAQIVVPVSAKAIAAVVMLNVIGIWSELQLASILLIKGESRTLPVGLVGFQGQYQTDLGVQAAGLFIAAIPVVLLYVLFSRRVTEGMEVGVLK